MKSVSNVGLHSRMLLPLVFALIAASAGLLGYAASDFLPLLAGPDGTFKTFTQVALAGLACLACTYAAQYAKLARIEAAVADEKRHLTVAVDNMSFGLLLFDAATRIVVVNRQYIEMYGLSPEIVKPGCLFADLIAHRKATGSFSGDLATYVDEILDYIKVGRKTELEYTAADGRIIHIINQPLQFGGWVATHEDVTEQRAAAKGVSRSREFLNDVIDNVPVALMVKDAVTRTYVLINRAAEAMWNISRERAIGKTARELFPQQHADSILRADERVISTGEGIVLGPHPGIGQSTDYVVTSKRLPLLGPMGKITHLVSVVEDVTERVAAEARIVHLANHDALTDLPNRRFWHEQLSRVLQELQPLQLVAVLCLDLDNFKIINDTLGHPVGDALLRIVAERLKTCLQPGDFVARLGGDEFGIVQTSCEQESDVVDLTDSILRALEEPCDANGHKIVVESSIGIALAPWDSVQPERLLRCADLALYQAKAGGRRNYRFFEPAMQEALETRQTLEADLQRALSRNEFEVVYQPIIGVRTGDIQGCEVLLRWHHPERGQISPVTFIPIAEETGLIKEIGLWVIRQACAEAMTWPPHFRVSVNVSPVQFIEDSFGLHVLNVLAETGLPPHRLELEITESVLIRDDEKTTRLLSQLRAAGVKIAMDDFGTGFCSLRYLQRFPFDRIKIDRSFVSELMEPGLSQAIVEAIINIAEAKGVETTAEGVETAEQWAALQRLGCTDAQGFYFSRPLRRADLVAKLNLPRGSAMVVEQSSLHVGPGFVL